MKDAVKTNFEKIVGIRFGEFLEQYVTLEVERGVQEEFPFIYNYLFKEMRIKFKEINFYSLFFENGLSSRIIELLVSYSELSPRLPSPLFRELLRNLEGLLSFLDSHPLFKKETLSSRTNTYLNSIGKRTSLQDIRNFSGSLWFELYAMASFLVRLPESISGCAEFLEKKEDRENCDGRFITNMGEVTLLEFKNKNLSHGEIENDLKTSVNDFLINHRFDLGTFIRLFYPDCLESMPGFLVAWPLYYEEAIEDLDKALAEIDPLLIKEKTPKLKKGHEKLLLLKMIELYSQDTTNDKGGFLLPTDESRVAAIATNIRKVKEKEFWRTIFNKALGQLSETTKCHLKEGYKVNKCLVYVFWQRPPSMYPDVFAEDPARILNLTFDSFKHELESTFASCIADTQPEMLNIAQLKLLETFNFSELANAQKT
jgi:hypothetical protein